MFFLWFWGRPGRSMGWAHMQSVRAGAVETHFCVFACFLKNGFQKTSFWGPFWEPFSSKIAILCDKKGSKKRFKKRCPAKVKRLPIPMSGGSRTAPPMSLIVRTRNNNLSKKQQQLLISGSISESLSWNRSFLHPFLENCAFVVVFFSIVALTHHFLDCLSHVQGPWSDTPWAKARRIYYF